MCFCIEICKIIPKSFLSPFLYGALKLGNFRKFPETKFSFHGLDLTYFSITEFYHNWKKCKENFYIFYNSEYHERNARATNTDPVQSTLKILIK